MAFEDPFGGQVERFGRGVKDNVPLFTNKPFEPKSQTQGPQLSNGNITPQIVVEIAGDPKGRRPDIKNFTLRTDIQQLYDPFSFSVPDPDGELLWLLDEVANHIQVPIRIYHKDPFVNNNVERPWLRGAITRASVSSGLGGSVVQVSGYDLGFLLTSCAPVGAQYDLRGVSWPRLVQLIIDPSWLLPAVSVGKLQGSSSFGFRAINGISLSRQLRQGRLDAEAQLVNKQLQDIANRTASKQDIQTANNVNFKAYTPKVLIQPGETVGDILCRYAKFDRRFVGVSPEGDLEFFQPDYSTPPQFVANYNRQRQEPSDLTRQFTQRPSDAADLNNMLDGSREVDGEQRYNRVVCFGSILYGMAFYERDNPFEGMTRGIYDQYNTTSDYFLRRMTFSDNERYTNERALQRAIWRYQQGIYNSDTVTFTAQGHSQNGIAFAANARIEVRSDKLRVNEVRYISAVEYHQEDRGDEGIASTTRLFCKKDKVLGA